MIYRRKLIFFCFNFFSFVSGSLNRRTDRLPIFFLEWKIQWFWNCSHFQESPPFISSMRFNETVKWMWSQLILSSDNMNENKIDYFHSWIKRNKSKCAILMIIWALFIFLFISSCTKYDINYINDQCKYTHLKATKLI